MGNVQKAKGWRHFYKDLTLNAKFNGIILVTCGLALVVTGGTFFFFEYQREGVALRKDLLALAESTGFIVEPYVAFDEKEDAVRAVKKTLSSFEAQEIELVVLVYDGTKWDPFAEYPEGVAEDVFPKIPNEQAVVRERNHIVVTHQEPAAPGEPEDFLEFADQGDDEWDKVLSMVAEQELVVPWETLETLESDESVISHVVMLRSSLVPIRRQLWITFRNMLFVLGGAMAVAMLIARKLVDVTSGPILELGALAETVSREKNYSLRASKRSEDEVGRLIDSFNQMLSRVEAADRELQQSHAELESKVEQRTAELSQAMLEAEDARDSAQRANEAKSQFLANMSHEIRTPMNAILGYSQILRREANLPPKQMKELETIQRSGDHLLGMINDILDLSKIEAGRMELQVVDFDLCGLVFGLDSMFRIRCEQKGVKFEVDLGAIMDDEGSMPVRGDDGKLRQILINLLGNAVKFTDQGQISLVIGPGQGEDRFRFEVRDTGAGMAADSLAQLFDPFQQGDEGMKKGGTGLGLAITKRQLDLMGSALEVESTLGSGSSFRFELSLPRSQVSSIRPPSQEEREVIGLAEGEEVDVLVVDDVAENRDVLSSLLLSLGCGVRLACSGEEAIGKVREKCPDLIFMDMRMPGMDGRETAEAILQEFGTGATKLVAISASVLRHEQERCLKAGFDRFLSKPFRTQEICDCLETFLGVRLLYREDESAEVSRNQLDYAQIELPGGVLASLKEYAGLYWATEVRRTLKQIPVEDPQMRRFVLELEELSDLGDMERIVEILERLPQVDVEES